VATRNPGKLVELREALAPFGYVPLDLDAAGVAPSPDEALVEVHGTFEANALAKAAYYAERAGRVATLADDSGLCVDALGGAPGVHSRRWSGIEGADVEVAAANNAKLLATRGAIGSSARFVCVVALLPRVGAEPVLGRGEVVGRIAATPRGSGGFGYDPLFEAEELAWRTFGEASAAEKARVSHRSRAIAALRGALARGAAPGSG
jgi:XTP/dITP diphosphohydrolase